MNESSDFGVTICLHYVSKTIVDLVAVQECDHNALDTMVGEEGDPRADPLCCAVGVAPVSRCRETKVLRELCLSLCHRLAETGSGWPRRVVGPVKPILVLDLADQVVKINTDRVLQTMYLACIRNHVENVADVLQTMYLTCTMCSRHITCNGSHMHLKRIRNDMHNIHHTL